MYILGINAYHAGSSACLIRDGELIAAVEEERFRRIKYWAGFPREAIRYCLQKAGITARDLDHIGISRDPTANLYKKALHTLRKRPSFGLIKERLANLAEVRDFRKAFCEAVGLSRADVRAEFHNVEHHRAHMASAFFVSPFPDAAVLSIDGFGDFVSTMAGVGSGSEIEVLDAVNYPHSLGIFFTAVTQWLGFPKFGDEGKIQGLAAYGRPTYLDDLRHIVRLQPGGSFELDLDYFIHWAEGVDMTWLDGSPVLGTIYSQKFVDRFGPPREPGAEITERYANMAASAQAMLEEAEFHLVRNLQKRTGKKALCLAGGVALNSTFNGKIIPETEFEDVFIQPAAGDAGTALGVAYYIYHHVLGRPRRFVMRHAYTGPSFGNGAIEEALHECNLAYETHDEESLADACAELIAEGNVVGWFQGNMEWGPRALGNRSILADPRRAEMKDILNARIKHREAFRPFAPSILMECVGDYFDQSYPEPFMIKVYKVLPHKRQEIPAVTHVDGTGRLQTVDVAANPLYWRLIKAFAERTGVPVVLNTSFNENEPIVCRPEEAIDCFLRTKMDALAIGNYLIRKQSPLHSGVDMPDSRPHMQRPGPPSEVIVERATPSPCEDSIEPLQIADVPAAVELHMAHLTERLSGEPGRRLLSDYYRRLCSGEHGICLVARRSGDGRPAGMVVLRWGGQRLLWALWIAHPIRTTVLLVWQIVDRPASVGQLMRSLWERKPAQRLWRQAGSPSPFCILHALVTDPHGRGRGRMLVEAALREARRRGFKWMVTSTYSTIEAANHLYQTAGFTLLLKTMERHHEVNWYGRSV